MNRPIQTSSAFDQLSSDIQFNCDISDARDHGIYSMCSLVLKLRNLYKWEQQIEPWDEAESSDLLDWIEAKEHYWETLAAEDFLPLKIADRSVPADDVLTVNEHLHETRLFYGAGHGRSMKAIFFLAEIAKRLTVEGCPVVILDRELAREMAAPFAMVQEGEVIIRSEPLRFFLWDHIQELRSSCRSSLQFFLKCYGLLEDGVLSQQKFRDVLDQMVASELDLFIHHEVGEICETGLSSGTLQQMISRFPGSVIEFVCRAVKDVLADTHPRGVLAHITGEEKESSLGLYVSFLDGLREELFPEMARAWKSFLKKKAWSEIESARVHCRTRMLQLAENITEIASTAGSGSDRQVQDRFNRDVLEGLGLAIPR